MSRLAKTASRTPDPILVRLDRLGAERPELSELVRVYRELLPRLIGDVPSPSLPEISSAELSEKLTRGVPLLRDVRLQFNSTACLDDWRDFCELVPSFRDASALEKSAISAIQPESALLQILSSDSTEFREELQRTMRPAVVFSLLRLWCLPRLAPLTEALQCHWAGLGWSYGYCPACGGWPLLAEFRGLEQFRWLRCGLCGSGWQVDRIYCPFCGTRDHRQIQDLFVDGEEQKYRVSVCDACGGFVRAISTLGPLSTPGLLVAELQMLHLELLAQARGYIQPGAFLS